MLGFYNIYYILKNATESVELARSYGGCKCCKGEPETERAFVTWDNAIDALGRVLDFHVEVKKRRRGRVLTIYQWFETPDKFKEWERPELDLVLIKEYEPTKKSIQEVLNYRDGNVAIEYLLERGINYLGK